MSGRVEHVLDADRQPVEGTRWWASVAAPRLFQRGVRVEKFPSLNVRFACLNSREAGADERFRG